jgi:hypothetical protein
MPRLALRLLLAVCLIINGMGNAMAAVAMPFMADMPHEAVLVTTGVEALPGTAPCGHDESAATAAEQGPTSTPPAGHPADCEKDCCAKGTCACACVNLAQAATLDVVMPASSPSRTRMGAFVALGHSSQVPLNLIRPPIG